MAIRLVPAFLTRTLLTRRIRRLATKAQNASPRYRASFCARAGDQARDSGLRQDALCWYGEAIDGYLQAGRGRAAELVCERLLEAYPEVVRARYTLALIAIGHGETGLATLRVRHYMEAMLDRQTEDVMVPALLQMASVTSEPSIRSEIALSLERAEERELVVRVREGRAAPADSTSWSRSVLAALRHPAEVDVEPLTGAG